MSRYRSAVASLRSRGGRVVIGLGVAAVVVIVSVLLANGSSAADATVTSSSMMVASGSAGDEVSLDTTLLVPETATMANPAPAVIVAHGFGGSKDSVTIQAEDLAAQGFVVLTYSARGFGDSTGQIGLDSPDYEVADASHLIDLLAERADVVQDAPGDPRVGITGPSYGGALALLTAGYDDRVDAIVPQITWHSLVDSFFPNSVGGPVAQTPAADSGPSVDGVFKKLWAGLFFSSGADPSGSAVNPQCGRFRPEVCAAYAEAATTGRLSETTAALLERSSPASVLDRITAPTLLIQGQSDTLFPLSQADANARGIAASGTPVRVDWYSGGHDAAGSANDTARLAQLTTQWFDFYLKGVGPDPGTGFEFAAVTGLSTTTGRATSQVTDAKDYPGLRAGATTRTDIALRGGSQFLVNPAGGTPAAISTLPGLTRITSVLGGVVADLPGQAAVFQSAPLTAPAVVVGTSTVSIRIASTTGQAVLFAKLYDVGPDGSTVLPQGLVAPIRVDAGSSTVDTAAPVMITLPGIAHRFEVGHRLRVVLASTDQAFGGPIEPAAYQVALAAGAALNIPTVEGALQNSAATPWIPTIGILAGITALAVIAGLGWNSYRRRTRRLTADPALAGKPLVIQGLSKVYADGFVAVHDLSFDVEIGQVVGLLGPNGAGKTTTLRMLMGLITPTAGRLQVFGHRVRPGAEVLSRLGAFVEGTGFLPHLSGLDNLTLYWQATGRPSADARLREALEIAGLGTAVDKKVGTYSQGMRQRLAIAQSMLGLPDLLVLDEPTNGLDPPQIREMRAVLRRYVEGTGRTVLVSSHLLSEVEQTCSHVVVMHRGELVAQGTVAEVVGESSSVLLSVDDPAGAVRVLSAVSGVDSAQDTPDGVVVDIGSAERSNLVRELVAAGIGVQQMTPRRRLEDVFIALVGAESDGQ